MEARALEIHLDANSVGYPVPPPLSSPSFMPNVLPLTLRPIFSDLGLRQEYAELHTL